jgi:hypothetical protein
MIRHGADYGPQQVDGSSLVSELDPRGRSDKESLRKDFLNDGAYQWMHVFKIGAEHKLGSFPLTIYGEAGVVYSYFTEIDQDEYEKYTPAPANTPPSDTKRAVRAGEYPTSTAFIFTLGFKVFL